MPELMPQLMQLPEAQRISWVIEHIWAGILTRSVMWDEQHMAFPGTGFAQLPDPCCHPGAA